LLKRRIRHHDPGRSEEHAGGDPQPHP
jgi:hypothetical protein